MAHWLPENKFNGVGIWRFFNITNLWHFSISVRSQAAAANQNK